MAKHCSVDTKDVVTGYFGSTTQGLLTRFQMEQGIPPAPQAGPLTRAAIARLCGPGMGMMGSTTSSQPERQEHSVPVLPKAPPAPPVSYRTGESNAASVIEAISEISDGYGRLITATLGLIGLN